jgi:hypothetical protein
VVEDIHYYVDVGWLPEDGIGVAHALEGLLVEVIDV